MTNLDLEINENNPWVGLQEFTEEIQSFFHGREEETESLLNRVRRRVLTVLFGQSGLGKSSLLQAGLFPRLRAERFLPVYIRLNYKEAATLREQVNEFITSEVSRAIERGELSAKPDGEPVVSPVPSAHESIWSYLHRRVSGLRDPGGQPVVPVLVFDQFEEIFTHRRRGDIAGAGFRPFLRELADCVENRVPEPIKERLEREPDARDEFANLELARQEYRVILSLREDYVAYLDDLSEMMPCAMENRMRLPPLDGRQALKAVLNPGEKLVKSQVARRIVRFVAASKRDEFSSDGAGDGEVGEELDLGELKVDPALLSMVCLALNKKRLEATPPLPEISVALLKDSSKSILRDFYSDCFREPQMQPVRKFVEEQLLTGSDFRDSIELERAKAELHKLGVKAPASVLERLIKQRLLRVVEKRSDSEPERLELTHDVLTGVVSESRRERHHLEQKEAAEGERREREAQALRESEERRREAETRAREAEASRIAAQKQLRAAHRRALAFAVLLVVAAGGLGWGARERWARYLQARLDSEDNFNFATLRSGIKLDATSNSAGANPDSADLRGTPLALTHFASALNLNPKHSRSARFTVKLLSEKRWCPPRTPALKYPTDLKYGQPGKALLATTWAPDGKIVSLAEDGTVLRADDHSTEFSTAAQQLDPKPDKLSSAAFSDDGRWLLTVSSIGPQGGDPVLQPRLWKWDDASAGKGPGYRNYDAELPFTLTEDVRSTAWSPDGKWLVITTSNPANCVVHYLANSISDADAVLRDKLRQSNISAADFSADGKLLITGSIQGEASRWNLDEPAQLPWTFKHKNEQGGNERIMSVAFNPKREQFVTVSFDNVRLWNSNVEPADQQPTYVHDAQRDRILRAAFSRDGKYLITGTMTGVAQIWNLTEKPEPKPGKNFLGKSLGEPVWHLGTAGIGLTGYVGFSPGDDTFVTCVGPIWTKPDSLRFWSLPRLLPSYVKTGASKKRAPDWLPKVAEAVSGIRLTPHGYESTPAESSLTEVEKKIPASSKRSE